MFRSLDDFSASYTNLCQGTGRIFGALTDESLDMVVAPGHRSLGGIAWHIVTAVPEIMQRTGLPLSAVDPESMPPTSATEIRRTHQAVADDLTRAIAAAWSDASLVVTDDMYGESWPRGMTLAVLIDHEIHHRGQMTVLMRQAGLRVPGVFGPAQEDWEQYGKPRPAY